MAQEYAECQLNTAMEDVESLLFDEFEVAFYTNAKPILKAQNEDSIGVFHTSDGHLVAAVADGMGGHKDGAKASKITIETIADQLKGFTGSEYDLRGAIFDAIELANIRVQVLKVRAGTTLTLASFSQAGIRIYNVGDSATFHFSNIGGIKYRSYEHSVGGMEVLMGRIKETQSGTSDDHHQLINYVGYPQMKMEISALIGWKPADMVLLGSDGLFDNIVVAEVKDVLRTDLEIDEKLRVLTEMGKDNMSHGILRKAKPDDMSAILISSQYGEES
ncbi:MAG: protein phosphatase 2C domain-containing protein [Bdellovibrionales bacterium]|nr:protein phosphatase 2C domain-containing protein [Bdellovibrionales bacterium]